MIERSKGVEEWIESKDLDERETLDTFSTVSLSLG